MTARAVHWHEGMFLRPHQLQTEQRYWAHQISRGEKWDLHYDWGLRSIELDLDALANHRLVVRFLEARLRDGTLVAIPEDGNLPNLDLKDVFEHAKEVTIYLGVPVLNLGRANLTGGTVTDGARFRLDTQELEDENTGINPQPVQVRLLNIKLLLSTHDHAGYEVLPIARITKSSDAQGTPQLAVGYIPPLLACDAWQPLAAKILEQIYDRIGKKIELLANQVVSRSITFDSHAQGDPVKLAQLRMLNEAYALLGILVFAQGIHPLHAYLELCRAVGQLAILKEPRRPPGLPKYDHDDLGPCFSAAKKHLDDLLDAVEDPNYHEQPFIGAGKRMEVTVQPAWLQPAWHTFVGVQCKLNPEDTIRLVTKPQQTGGLNMKLGSSDRVDEIFRLGQRGLLFNHTPRPPTLLPVNPGLVYFQVARDSQKEEWDNVQKSLTVAMRLNESLIMGDIQGQQKLTVKAGNQTVEMTFTLYVVPQAKSASP